MVRYQQCISGTAPSGSCERKVRVACSVSLECTLVLQHAHLASPMADPTALLDRRQPEGQNALLGTTARGARLTSKPATPLLASTVQPDRHRTQKQYVQQGITAQEVLMICQPAASPLASTARWDRHQAQERSVLLDIIVLEVPMTSRVVPWATRRQQEVALPQAAGSLRVQTLWYLMETNSTRVYAPMMYPRTRIFGIFVLLRSGIPSTLKSGATTSAKTVGLAFQAVLQLQKRARVSGTIMVFVH